MTNPIVSCPAFTQAMESFTFSKEYKWFGCPLGTPTELGCSPMWHKIPKGTKVMGQRTCIDASGVAQYYVSYRGIKIPMNYFVEDPMNLISDPAPPNWGRPPVGSDTETTKDPTRPPVYWATADSFEIVNPVKEERKKKIINILVSVATAIAVYMLLTKFATKKLKS
jgi:hypothetical protein